MQKKRRPSSSPLRVLGRHAVVREGGRVERAVGIPAARRFDRTGNNVLVTVASRSLASSRADARRLVTAARAMARVGSWPGGR